MTKTQLEQALTELIDISRKLLHTAKRPKGAKCDADAVLRAETFFSRLDYSGTNNSWELTMMNTLAVPGLLREHWRIYYEVIMSEEDYWTDPIVFGMLEADIHIERNKALKTILIPRI